MSIHNLPQPQAPIQLSIEPDETARLLLAIPVERLHYLDAHIVYAARARFEERGPCFSDAQRAAVRRIAEAVL